MTIAANIGDLAILDFEACFPDSVVGFFPSSDLDIEYLFYLFSSMKGQFLQTAPVNTQANLNVARIGSMPLVVPPSKEQSQIARFLNSECHQIATATKAAQRQIDLVREYRTRLIADVVTGKLDVRDVSLPDLGKADGLDDLDDLEEDAELEDLDVEELNDADD
jgi:type I restriction enzyme S subunit